MLLAAANDAINRNLTSADNFSYFSHSPARRTPAQLQQHHLWSPPGSRPGTTGEQARFFGATEVADDEISLGARLASAPSSSGSLGQQVLPPITPPMNFFEDGYRELTRKQSIAMKAEEMLRLADTAVAHREATNNTLIQLPLL